MGTSDLHERRNWDYYKDTYSDSAGNAVGLARVASLVKQIRADRGREHTLLFDAATRSRAPARVLLRDRRARHRVGATHPMAAQMNALEYDAVALGNHEFNYGLDFLDNWISQMDAPCSPRTPCTRARRFPGTRRTPSRAEGREGAPARQGRRARALKPGVVIWDKANVSGKVEVLDLVETAKALGSGDAPRRRHRVVSAHSGESGCRTWARPADREAASSPSRCPTST